MHSNLFYPAKSGIRLVAILSVTLCMGMYLIFEIFDLDGSKFHIDVVDLDGTNCFELRSGQIIRADSGPSNFLGNLPRVSFFSRQMSYLSYLHPLNSSAKMMSFRNLSLPTAQLDYARPPKLPRSEHTSETISADEPA